MVSAAVYMTLRMYDTYKSVPATFSREVGQKWSADQPASWVRKDHSRCNKEGECFKFPSFEINQVTRSNKIQQPARK